MGRPRKLKGLQVQVEEEEENYFGQTADTARVEQTVVQPIDGTDARDVDTVLINPIDLGFIDLLVLNGSHEQGNENYIPKAPRPPTHFFTSNPHLTLDINFDAPPPIPTAELPTSPTQPALLSDIINDLKADLLQLDANLAFPAAASASSPQSYSCSCLPNLHRSVTSLQHLCDTLPSAIETVRTACKTLHDALLCPRCSNPSLLSTTTRQTLLLQATLLPTLSTAYIHLLSLIDASATLADSESRKLTFQLTSYGGLWGMLGANDHICGAARADELAVQPEMWRLAVRALLRIDIYGINENSTDWQGLKVCAGFVQPGLMDFVKMMQEREQARRLVLEETRARGEVDGGWEGYRVWERTGPAIERILHVARESLRGLQIA
jgi:hypothetical protein